MLTDSQRIAGRTSLGACVTCGAPLYPGALGPEHLRFLQDRDHAATLTK
jgi:hypothetical protein